MARKKSQYTLTGPCSNCPFRCDQKFYLSYERASEIARELLSNSGDFFCHKTVDYSTDDGNGRIAPKSRVCGGALVTMEKSGLSTQMMRIAERLGLYDREKLDMDAPVYDSLDDWVMSYMPEPETVVDEDGNEFEFEHCEIVGLDCEDPAGWGMAGGVTPNTDPPTCNPLTDTCSDCGRMGCSACIAEVQERKVGERVLRIVTCEDCAISQ